MQCLYRYTLIGKVFESGLPKGQEGAHDDGGCASGGEGRDGGSNGRPGTNDVVNHGDPLAANPLPRGGRQSILRGEHGVVARRRNGFRVVETSL